MRKAARRTLFLILAASFSLDAAAMDCQARLSEWLHVAYPDAVRDTDSIGDLLSIDGARPRVIRPNLAVCKVWPAAPEKMLLVVRLGHPAASDFDVDGETADLEVLVADSTSPRILQRYRENRALQMQGSAIRISSVTIDTARYRLNDSTTAFGVRIGYSGVSRASPYSRTVLNLYASDGKRLRPVLRKLEVALDRGDWDTQCAGEFESAQRTIAIDGKRDHGYAGLVINSIEETRRNLPKGEECADVPGPKNKTSARLAFDGREYAVPAAWRGQ